jgi:hypothetical protein
MSVAWRAATNPHGSERLLQVQHSGDILSALDTRHGRDIPHGDNPRRLDGPEKYSRQSLAKRVRKLEGAQIS